MALAMVGRGNLRKDLESFDPSHADAEKLWVSDRAVFFLTSRMLELMAHTQTIDPLVVTDAIEKKDIGRLQIMGSAERCLRFESTTEQIQSKFSPVNSL